eukprot:GHVT01086245.1.p1 GENE.GHVT01086245.1~~GHVT01086245.1.p1  ORF type:complete len:241 (-),score=35.11 GHVT01086245.1:967-1689(-)
MAGHDSSGGSSGALLRSYRPDVSFLLRFLARAQPRLARRAKEQVEKLRLVEVPHLQHEAVQKFKELAESAAAGSADRQICFRLLVALTTTSQAKARCISQAEQARNEVDSHGLRPTDLLVEDARQGSALGHSSAFASHGEHGAPQVPPGEVENQWTATRAAALLALFELARDGLFDIQTLADAILANISSSDLEPSEEVRIHRDYWACVHVQATLATGRCAVCDHECLEQALFTKWGAET